MHRTGSAVMSGALNGTRAFVLEATAAAADSQYPAIVSLVQQAAESRAPLVRLAERYAVPFTAVAHLIAGMAWWLSQDPVRCAAVLVVATPCPLLIAAPVAFLGGVSRAAPSGGSGRPCRPERRIQPSRDWTRTKARSSSPSTSRDSRKPWAS